MTDPNHIFISYARQDGLTFAERLDNELQSHHKLTWRDKRNLDPNQDFTAELEKAIETASHVVVCLTPDTKRDNSFVRREIGYALALNKRIIPLAAADVVPPIHIINLTRIEFHRQAWSLAFSELLQRLDQPATVYEQATPPFDPFREYLNQRYQEIINYLDTTVFSLIALHAQSAPGQVQQEIRRSLPVGFSGLPVKPMKPSQKELHTSFDTFPQAFEHFDGRVLLLGEPGAGKTTTLMAFARDAIARRLADPSQPLPLLNAISTWDADKAPSLTDWISEQSAGIATQPLSSVITEGKALLLLDALDELGSEHEDSYTGEKYDPRLKFMDILPTNNQVLVSCRVKDYDDIGKKIALVGAIRLQHLDNDQMADYLRDQPDLWEAVRNDDGLREMARTPLLLSLFTYAYQGMGEKAHELRNLKDSPGDLRDTVFRSYIRRRYERELAKSHTNLDYDIAEIYEILGWVATEDILPKWKPTSIRALIDRIVGTPDSFIHQMQDLHLLVSDETNEPRFIHLLMRDHFALQYCLTRLGDKNVRARRDSITALIMLADNRSSGALIHTLKHDEDGSIRELAAQALGMLGGQQAVKPLIEALTDPKSGVRREAVQALGLIRDYQSVNSLVTALHDKRFWVQQEAVIALTRIGTPEALAAVEQWKREHGGS